jgi:hypothetical protein
MSVVSNGLHGVAHDGLDTPAALEEPERSLKLTERRHDLPNTVHDQLVFNELDDPRHSAVVRFVVWKGAGG